MVQLFYSLVCITVLESRFQYSSVCLWKSYTSASQTCPGVPLPCTFCSLPNQTPPNLVFAVSTNELMRESDIVRQESHTKGAGQGVLEDRFGKHCTILSNKSIK